MKPILIFFTLLIIKGNAFAQKEFRFDDDDVVYATIKDTDGFVNVRKEPSANAPILGKIYKYAVFACESNKSNWWKVSQIDNNSRSYELQGYVYKDKVLLLKEWKEIKRENPYADSSIFKKGNISVVIKQKTFQPKQHGLIYSKPSPQKNTIRELLKIDGKRFWGTDGEIPKRVLVSVKVDINGKFIILTNSAFGDLYEPRLKNISICKGPDDILYISMSNSDGAGAYTIIWIIKDNKYFGRYIDDSMV